MENSKKITIDSPNALGAALMKQVKVTENRGGQHYQH